MVLGGLFLLEVHKDSSFGKRLNAKFYDMEMLCVP